MSITGGIFSEAVKERQILRHLFPELSHLPDDQSFTLYREWIYEDDIVRFTVNWKEPGNRFSLTGDLPGDMTHKEPVDWELQNLQLEVQDIDDSL